ncbi:sigma factor-like helix-turn-helix DNA-binding protein [Pseudomonas wadenswilerensis]
MDNTGSDTGLLSKVLPDHDPLSAYGQRGNNVSLKVLLERLPERERQIVVGHYYQQLSFVQLAELLGGGEVAGFAVAWAGAQLVITPTTSWQVSWNFPLVARGSGS